MLEWAVAAHLSSSVDVEGVVGPSRMFGREARAPHPAGLYSTRAQQLSVFPALLHTTTTRTGASSPTRACATPDRPPRRRAAGARRARCHCFTVVQHRRAVAPRESEVIYTSAENFNSILPKYAMRKALLSLTHFRILFCFMLPHIPI